MMEQTTVLPISAINSMNYLQLIIMHEVWLQYLDTLYPDFLPCHYYHTASFVAAWIADNAIVSWKYPLKSTYSTFFYMFPPVKCEGVYSSVQEPLRRAGSECHRGQAKPTGQAAMAIEKIGWFVIFTYIYWVNPCKKNTCFFFVLLLLCFDNCVEP